MRMKKTRIVIADDHPLLLRGLKFLIEDEESFLLIGEAKDGPAALRLIEGINPDVAILDIDMPHFGGLEILEKLRSQNYMTRVIILTMHNEIKLFNKAVLLAVDGYLLKESIDTEIISAIKAVVRGKKYFDPVLSGKFINDAVSLDKRTSIIDVLTPAEKKVLKLVAQNKTTKEIADILFVSKRTIDRHRSNICSTLGLAGHNSLIHFVLENKNLL